VAPANQDGCACVRVFMNRPSDEGTCRHHSFPRSTWELSDVTEDGSMEQRNRKAGTRQRMLGNVGKSYKAWSSQI
jgi:hypothetical protein